MRLYRILPVITLGIFLSCASAQDILTRALNCALAQEWNEHYTLCVRVLKYKGEGKDDYALTQLSTGVLPLAKELYKIGKLRPSDGFWNQMATAGAVPMTWACVVPAPPGVAVPVPPAVAPAPPGVAVPVPPAVAPAPPGVALPARPAGIDCQIDLSNRLTLHFAARPEDLGKAATDYDTSPFLGLHDLLVNIPESGFPAFGVLPARSRDEVARVYRNCFLDPISLFNVVKGKLGQQ